VSDAKVVIAGAGRAGTTLLLQVLTELGLDTGFARDRPVADQLASDGAPPPESPKAPRVVSGAGLAHRLGPMLDIKGIDVSARQYAAVVFGGMMAGLGGAFLTVGSAARFVPEMTNGRGWLAIVIVIAGMWRPVPVLLATLAFSFLDALQLQIQGIGVAVPYQLLLAMPYIFAILALAIRRSHSGAPAMLGVAYWRR